jgi:peptidoglycan/LPS O-acetylase OafA/YrhL
MVETQTASRTAENSVSASGARRAFHTLDGIRGVAALIIVMRHAGSFFAGTSFSKSFLAVDLFFLMSGFVIAFAYGEKIASGRITVFEFLKIRLIRLYPLYLFGLTIGIIYCIGSIMYEADGWHISTLLEAIGMGILMLPGIKGVVMGGSALDAPTWTLFPELLANIFYAALCRRMTIRVLASITAIGAAGIVYSEIKFGTLDLGWDVNTFAVSMARVTFSFFLGILLFKLIGDKRKTNNNMSWLSLVVTAAALLISAPPTYAKLQEMFLVFAGFPCIIIFACQNEPSVLSGRIMRFLGLISYAVYALHAPSAQLIAGLVDHVTRFRVERYAPWVGIAFIIFMIIVSWIVDMIYDAPARRSLTRLWRNKPTTPGPAPIPLR